MEEVDFDLFPSGKFGTAELLRRQDEKTVTSLTLNLGGDKRLWDLAKTLWSKEVADQNTAIFVRSYDFIENHLNPEDEDHIDYGKKFVKFGGLATMLKDLYDREQMTQKQEKEFETALQMTRINSIPRDRILARTPDNGNRYEQRRKKAKNNPVIMPRQMVRDQDLMDSKNFLIYEENPHEMLCSHITMPFHADNEEGVYQKMVKHDLVGGNWYDDLVESVLNRLQIRLDQVYKVASDEPSEKQIVDPSGKINQIFEEDSRYRKKNGEYFCVWSEILKKQGEDIRSQIRDYDDNNELGKRNELAELLENLQTLQLMEELEERELRVSANWSPTKDNTGKTYTVGDCMWDDGGHDALLCVAEQFLTRLERMSQKVLINYAETDKELVEENAEDPDYFQIEVPDNNPDEPHFKTNVHIIQQSFAEKRIEKSDARRRRLKLAEQIRGLFGEKTSSISYKEVPSDFDFGNRGFDCFKDCFQVIGTPRKNGYAMAKEYFKHYGEFPSCLEKDKVYGTAIEESAVDNDGYTIDGYIPPRVNKIYEQVVIRLKRDGQHRLREQHKLEKDLVITDQEHEILTEFFEEEQITRYDDVDEYLRTLLTRLALSDIEPDGMEMAYKVSRPPYPLYRKGDQLHRASETVEKIKQFARRSIGEVASNIDTTDRTVSRNIEKSPDLYTEQSEEDGRKEIVCVRFDLADIFPSS